MKSYYEIYVYDIMNHTVNHSSKLYLLFRTVERGPVCPKLPKICN